MVGLHETNTRRLQTFCIVHLCVHGIAGPLAVQSIQFVHLCEIANRQPTTIAVLITSLKPFSCQPLNLCGAGSAEGLGHNSGSWNTRGQHGFVEIVKFEWTAVCVDDSRIETYQLPFAPCFRCLSWAVFTPAHFLSMHLTKPPSGCLGGKKD